MGTGIQAGIKAGGDPALLKALDDMKDQLLLVLIQRLGGEVIIPVMDVNNTGGLIMTMDIESKPGSFVFKVGRKH